MMKHLFLRFWALLALTSVTCASPAQASDPLQDGIVAYEAGNYGEARTHWKSVASAKDDYGLWASYYLGLIHENGLGVDADKARARKLFYRVYKKFTPFPYQKPNRIARLKGLPVDAVFRLAMIDYEDALQQEDASQSEASTLALQNVRVALDIAGFFGHAQSFFQNGVMSEHGTGKRFLRDTKKAWAYYTLAAKLGHPDGAQEARRIEAKHKSGAQKKAQAYLADYEKYMIVPFVTP